MAASGEPLAIIAGGGQLPVIVAAAAEKLGRPALILGLEGEADPAIRDFRHEWIYWGKLGRTESLIKAHNAREIVMVGTIGRRPDWRHLGLDAVTLKALPRILAIAVGGDDSVLTGVVRFLEERGFAVVGAHTIATELVAEAGCLTRLQPDEAGRADSDLALRAALAIGLLDAGQAAVAIGGRVVALEGAEGTDAMLARVGDLRAAERIAWRDRSGVLGKCAKPQQDLRVDMPTVGVATVARLAALGLAGLVVEAGRVMMVDRDEMVAAADRAGLFILSRPLDNATG